MKLLIASNLISYTYNFRKEIIDEFIRLNHKVVIIAENDDSEKNKYFEKMGCTIYDVHFTGKGKNIKDELGLIKKYKSIIKIEKPNIVFSFTIKPNLYCGYISKKKKIPYVPMITGLGELEKKGKMQKILLFMHKKVMANAKHVFFQNEDNMLFFKEKKIKIKSFSILPGSGINLEKYLYFEYPKEQNGIVFAFVGRIIKEKGIEEYLAAAKYFKENGYNYSFLVAGKISPDYDEIIKKYVSAGIIEYLGIISDTSVFYKNIHCLILPTYHPEGLSNVLLECGASGRLSICTNRPGCKEVIKDGYNGLYCEKQDANNLIKTILSFTSIPYDEKVEMSKNARYFIEQNFNRRIVVEKYLELLKD